jgi:hypothetical protein
MATLIEELTMNITKIVMNQVNTHLLPLISEKYEIPLDELIEFVNSTSQEKIVAKPKGPTKKPAAKNSGVKNPLLEKIKAAQEQKKILNVSTGRPINDTADNRKKYKFYPELGIAGVSGDVKLINAVKDLAGLENKQDIPVHKQAELAKKKPELTKSDSEEDNSDEYVRSWNALDEAQNPQSKDDKPQVKLQKPVLQPIKPQVKKLQKPVEPDSDDEDEDEDVKPQVKKLQKPVDNEDEDEDEDVKPQVKKLQKPVDSDNEDEDEDEDVKPQVKKLQKPVDSDDEDEDEDVKPQVKKLQKPVQPVKPQVKKLQKPVDSDDEDDDVKPQVKKLQKPAEPDSDDDIENVVKLSNLMDEKKTTTPQLKATFHPKLKIWWNSETGYTFNRQGNKCIINGKLVQGNVQPLDSSDYKKCEQNKWQYQKKNM